MKVQKTSAFLFWLAAIITFAHTVIPHHHHDENTEYSISEEDHHHSDFGGMFHHVHGVATSDESTYLPHKSHRLDFPQLIFFSDNVMLMYSHSIINLESIVISDYGEPPPEIYSQHFLNTASFRGPPALTA